jgi:hypothetical protein
MEKIILKQQKKKSLQIKGKKNLSPSYNAVNKQTNKQTKMEKKYDFPIFS